jgi:hypothetical protein
LYIEAAGASLVLDDLQLPAVALLLAPVGQLLAAIGGVRPNLLEAWHEVRESAELVI